MTGLILTHLIAIPAIALSLQFVALPGQLNPIEPWCYAIAAVGMFFAPWWRGVA